MPAKCPSYVKPDLRVSLVLLRSAKRSRNSDLVAAGCRAAAAAAAATAAADDTEDSSSRRQCIWTPLAYKGRRSSDDSDVCRWCGCRGVTVERLL